MSPKSKLPLGSHGAKKSIGKLLTFYDRGGLQKVRLYNKPTGPPSAGQTAQRLVIASRVEAWQALSPAEKNEWNASAKALGDPWSGYTLFMSTYEEEGPMPHNLFSADHPDTVVGSPASGDIIYANATPKWTKLAKGDDDKVLTLKSGLPSWETPAGGAPSEEDLAFLDNFNDDERHWGWFDAAKNGSIVESGGVLTLSVANGVHGGLNQNNMPRCLMGDPGAPFEVKIKLNSYSVNNSTQAGICISSHSGAGAENQWLMFGRTRKDEDAGLNGLAISNFGSGWLASNSITTLPIYLRFRITVLGKDEAALCECAYSTDDESYTVLDTVLMSGFYDGYKDNFVVGVFARNRVGGEAAEWVPAISAPFDLFRTMRSLGPG